MAFQMGFISHFGLKRVLAARRLERRGWTGRGWARTDCGPLGALQGWGLLTPIRRFWVTRGRALCWTCGLDVWAGRGGWTRGLDAGGSSPVPGRVPRAVIHCRDGQEALCSASVHSPSSLWPGPHRLPSRLSRRQIGTSAPTDWTTTAPRPPSASTWRAPTPAAA